MNSNAEMGRKEREIQQFFKDAFCAESAKILIGSEVESYDVNGFIRIDTGDKRGIIYFANLENVKEKPERRSHE